ncbi:hypothetical protein BUALT_Bualt11G0006000 [Buddleja alternifolia]|uniref:Pentatricopeptide repeat-containing protein n=1 Tax=Buddleja alternifolia TaxID=168488 RepID=A0AAV6WRQ6_9LAMI|nr:hypothetical protein BUALT_Bualt11G0006000 [Buddleja alternifolia]
MIGGYSEKGDLDEALSVFHAMDEEPDMVTVIHLMSACGESNAETGFKPNHVTFLAVLQACTHAGLLEKGLKFFNMMTKTYEINPGLDHYSCMIDLVGRRGKLKETLKFIQEMPLQSDAGIWRALLSACKIHHNLEIADMRGEMKSKGVVKWPGQSVVVVDGKCCMFTVEDRCRWEGFGVFETLDG